MARSRIRWLSEDELITETYPPPQRPTRARRGTRRVVLTVDVLLDGRTTDLNLEDLALPSAIADAIHDYCFRFHSLMPMPTVKVSATAPVMGLRPVEELEARPPLPELPLPAKLRRPAKVTRPAKATRRATAKH